MGTELRTWSRRRPAPLPLLLPPPLLLLLLLPLSLLLLLGGLGGTQAQNAPIKFLLDGRCGPGTETISVRPPAPPCRHCPQPLLATRPVTSRPRVSIGHRGRVRSSGQHPVLWEERVLRKQCVELRLPGMRPLRCHGTRNAHRARGQDAAVRHEGG